MHTGAPSAGQSQAQRAACVCMLLGLGLPSKRRQAIIFHFCPPASLVTPPLKALQFCPQWRSICPPDTSSYSRETLGVKFSSRPCPRSWNSVALNQQNHLATRHDPSTQTFPPIRGHHWQTGEVGHAGLNPLLCLARAQEQHLCNTTFSLSPFPLPTAVFPALELHPAPQAWKKKGLICCSSCRLQYKRILGHPRRQNDICMLNAIELEHNALKPLRKSTGQLIWFKPIFKFYETHFQG